MGGSDSALRSIPTSKTGFQFAHEQEKPPSSIIASRAHHNGASPPDAMTGLDRIHDLVYSGWSVAKAARVLCTQLRLVFVGTTQADRESRGMRLRSRHSRMSSVCPSAVTD